MLLFSSFGDITFRCHLTRFNMIFFRGDHGAKGFSAFLFLCLSPFSVLFSCYTCSLSPPGSLTTLRLSAESTKLLKKSESQGEFHQPQNNIRRQKEISSQPATSNHSTVRLCLMYVEVIFFFHSDETRQELPKAPPPTCYFHLLLTYFSKLR